MFVKKKGTNFYKIKMYIKKCGCFVNKCMFRIDIFILIFILIKLISDDIYGPAFAGDAQQRGPDL